MKQAALAQLFPEWGHLERARRELARLRKIQDETGYGAPEIRGALDSLAFCEADLERRLSSTKSVIRALYVEVRTHGLGGAAWPALKKMNPAAARLAWLSWHGVPSEGGYVGHVWVGPLPGPALKVDLT